MTTQNRRKFLTTITGATALGIVGARGAWIDSNRKPFFEISLAEWSFHKSLFDKKMTNLEFPALAKKTFGINTVEYVNQFFKDKAEDTAYLNQLLQVCRDNGVTNHLIMIDGEGELGSTNTAEQTKAIENHYKWVGAAKYLGCKSIRVNAAGEGSPDDVQKAAIQGLGKLGEFAAKENINVIVENHGGNSSNGTWLAGVMKGVNKPNVGTLPDVGNFCLKRENDNCVEMYDRYKGTAELVPFAKGISAKTYDFDEKGNCVETDYSKIMKILKDQHFTGYIGIEYEGSKLSEAEGVKKTKALLERYLK
jgi:sugar phosphate isomerase/epimerase